MAKVIDYSEKSSNFAPLFATSGEKNEWLANVARREL